MILSLSPQGRSDIFNIIFARSVKNVVSFLCEVALKIADKGVSDKVHITHALN